jgi:hypothetical protein
MSPVTAEGVNRQPLGNQTVRIAALVVVGLVVLGVVLWLVLGHSSKHKAKGKIYHPIGPIVYHPNGKKSLAAESRFINTKFYWAGPQKGIRYEFTRTTKGYMYVRYLTKGAPIGNFKQAKYLVVATYPVGPGAYPALKKQAGTNATPGPGNSIIYQRPKDKKSVLMAFPGVPDQIEIFAPTAAQAVATAESGRVRPVR